MAGTLKAYEAKLPDSSDVSGAYRFCQDLADGHYENFPVASLLLPKRLRKHVAALYAFARIADDMSDEPEYEGRRRECLLNWRSMLADTGKRPPAHPVFVALGATCRAEGHSAAAISNCFRRRVMRSKNCSVTLDRVRCVGMTMPTRMALMAGLANGRQTTSPRASSSMKPILEKKEMPRPATIMRLTMVVELQEMAGSS